MEPIVVQYLEDDPKGDRWRLVKPINYFTIVGPIQVPAGYVTDFASAPEVTWSFFPPIGRHNRACMLHDYWYDHRLFEAELGETRARYFADREFYERLQAVEPKKWFRNWCMYAACRLFGGRWWRD
ncbi:DUF1353 domain-containing protein [Rudanella paleaurantiibacter]|uniref:DUF1353 domain-containing protein n=1 Tax=Rudanella paleaurantiibacter TaxID=2614655 RepID=A0A7J5TVA6_9BACT|nr:DUF1353 domain-containing protein [Rudanella paleaurantiibacter]KAB7728007.1 DUF1353 domain-containing protein [Rudanella paleaurantiibacter]